MKNGSFFVRGDIDGFFGLFIDNLVNLVIIVATLTGLFNMPADIVFGKIIPGAAIAILFGNIHFEKIGFGVGKEFAIGYLILTVLFLGLYLYEKLLKKELKQIT